ncbi:BCCT family transporter [Pseudoalteromonas sp. Hal099]
MDIHTSVLSGFHWPISTFYNYSTCSSRLTKLKEAINSIKNAALTNFDYVFTWGANILLLPAVGIAASPLGKIRLGGDKQLQTIQPYRGYLCSLLQAWVLALF